VHISKHPVVEKIEPQIADTLADFGYELVHMTFGGPAGHRRLTIYIDKPGGVTSNDCGMMAQRLSVLLETIEPVAEPWTLMVSSPGLERPLTQDEDFVRFTGQKAKVTIQPLGGKKRTRTGVIQAVANGQVTLISGQQNYEVPLADVTAAHLVHDWDVEQDR